MSTEVEPDIEATAQPEFEAPESEEDPGPRELESALLSIAMFGGLIVFAIGCTMFLWG